MSNLKERANYIGRNFQKEYKLFDINKVSDDKIETTLNKFNLLLKNMLELYDEFDKLNTNNTNKTYNQYLNRLNSSIQICQNNAISLLINKNQNIKFVQLLDENKQATKDAKKSIKYGMSSVVLGFISIALSLYWTTNDISNKKIVSDLNTSLDITTVKLSDKIQNQEKLIIKISNKLDSTLTNNLELNKKIVMLEKDIKATKSVANKGYKSLRNK
jgi:hypothetical protein